MERIVRSHYPHLDDSLLAQAMQTFYLIREKYSMQKKPSTSELLDWVQALEIGGIAPDRIRSAMPFAGVLLKKTEDLSKVTEIIARGRGL